MSSSLLDIIGVDYPNSCRERCKALFREWLKQNRSATWGELTNAVDIILSDTGMYKICCYVVYLCVYIST